MDNSRLKWMASIIVVVFVVAVSLFLFAEQPTPTPATGTPHTAAVSSLNPASATTTTSTRPKITWSPTSTEVILSPGESTSRDFTFTSNVSLQNAVIEAVPAIAGFLTIQPNSFPSITAGQPQSVHISYLIPTGTVLGTYIGTIHVRIGSLTLPQTLKVSIDVWNAFSNSDYSIKFPPGWDFQSIDKTQTGFFPVSKRPDPSSEYVGDIVVEVLQNPTQADLQTFYHTIAPVDLYVNSLSNTPFTVVRFSSAKFVGVFGMIPTDIIAVDRGYTIIEISDVGQLHDTDGILDLMSESIR